MWPARCLINSPWPRRPRASVLTTLSRPIDRRHLWALIVVVVLTALSFTLECRFDFNPRDEGFLWYGVQRIGAGALPLRDFQSYDPGRYYWCALFLGPLGGGPIALRLALALFQGAGVFFGLAVLRRLDPRVRFLLFAGALLTLWMVPRHKVFEPSLSLLAVLVGVRLLERPSPRRHFEAGLLMGLLVFVARNICLYTTAGLGALAVVAVAKLGRREALGQKAAALAAGAALGCVPMLALLTRPGFARAYWDSLILLARYPNLRLPVPWPWHIAASQGVTGLVSDFGVGLAFVVLLLMPFALFAFLGRADADAVIRNRVAVAAAMLSIPFAHHAFARADLSHLAQAIHPLLVASVAMAAPFVVRRAGRAGFGACALALLASLLVAGRLHPLASAAGQVPATLGGNDVHVFPRDHIVLDLVQHVREQDGERGRWLLAPDWPWVYAAMGWTSPTREIYFLFPASDEVQEEQIAQVDAAGVSWALVDDWPRDGRDDRRLSRTHPRLWRYLHERFVRVERADIPAGCELLHRRSAVGDNGGRP